MLFLDSRMEDGTAIIETDGREVVRIPLNREQRIDANGPLGKTVIAVRQGKMAIVRSPCPNQICVRTGWISRRGAITACIPNRVVVRIIDRKETGIDAVTK